MGRALIYLHWSREFSDDSSRDAAGEHRWLVDLTIGRKADEAADGLPLTSTARRPLYWHT
ncbi:hypothetical protein [Mycobacterium deserti]|uniref:Uncharacterized protein n=1 Tax=Mycobacterium deserti TaxID=2978347 RepID=A0ABT2MES2_9MYCO|nr:hypothetical protein [Mycobacterium deserti]MCT7660742.1 hypothetical protein [Mycobacterium deserti]